jgi:hypothetical protein
LVILSSSKLYRWPAKAINWLSSPGAAEVELGSSVGANVLPAVVNLQYPGEEASGWDKALYYGGNTGLSLAGGLTGGLIAAGRNMAKAGLQGAKQAVKEADVPSPETIYRQGLENTTALDTVLKGQNDVTGTNFLKIADTAHGLEPVQQNSPSVITKEMLYKYKPESEFNPNNKYSRANALDALQKRASNLGMQLSNDIDKVKEAQLKYVLDYNPAHNDVSTWIRKLDDIKTFEEAINDPAWLDYNEFNPDWTRAMADESLKSGKVKVYSSNPIEEKTANFVTPSKMEAISYSSDGNIYELDVPLQDVAWIDPTQGQYTPVDKGYGHFLKEDNRLPFARTLENTVNKPDLTYSQTRFNKKTNTITESDYFIKKYNVLENSFSNEELYNAFKEHNPLRTNGEFPILIQRSMFKKFANEYKKHLLKYKDGTLFEEADKIYKSFLSDLTEKQKELLKEYPNVFMDLLNYFDDRVSDKGITELLDMVVVRDSKHYTKFKTNPEYIIDELNKKTTSNISTSGALKELADGGNISFAPLTTFNIPPLQSNVKSNIVPETLLNPELGISRLTTKERLSQNPNLTAAQRQAAEGLGEYAVLHNDALIRQSLLDIYSDPSAVLGRLREKISTRQRFDALDFEQSRQMVSRLFAEGRDEEALNLIKDVSGQASKAGQDVQALSLWSKNTPEGAIKNAQKMVDSYNKLNPGKKITLTVEQANKIRELQKQAMSLPEGVPTTYYMKKYTNQRKPFYDLVI